MDGYIERQTLQDIADAIREKNGSEETYTPSEMAEAIRGIEGGGEGFDFSSLGYSSDFAEFINNKYKESIEYSKNKKDKFIGTYRAFWEDKIIEFFPNVDTSTSTDFYGFCYFCSNLLYVPSLDTSKGRKFDRCFYYCSKLKYVGALDLSSATDLTRMFYYCSSIDNITLYNVAKVTKFSDFLLNCTSLVNLKITNWKQTNMPIGHAPLLTPLSVHYIIQNAMSVADGATARTLTLHATAKANWETSEYYEQDLAVLEEKGITIA